MNINTGGPHILLFERDQQLTGLLISEFQLAGYECHTARTAVEVFDAIARQPIRLVLVNLAQAAAARKEFWVALDTQRRGRGVHVLTYQVTNLASYGASDPEDRSQTMVADIAVEGMLGIMTLVDAVRARVTGGSISGTLPRVKATPPPPTPSTGGYRSSQQSPATTNTAFSAGPVSAPQQRAQISPETGPQPIARSAPPAYGQPSQPSFPTNSVPPTPNNPGHSEKIRAVLYPNQRWSSPQNTTSFPTAQNHSPSRPSYDPQSTVVPPDPAPAPETTVLQRLANGQLNAEESGLAQLSRMVRERQEYQTAPSPFATQPPNDVTYGTPLYQQPVQPAYRPPSPPEPPAPTARSISPSALSYTAPVARPASENISAQPLRASPIQDMPTERPTISNSSQAHQTLTEGIRRPDVLSRTNYGQQPQHPVQPTSPAQTAQTQQPAPSGPTVLSSDPSPAPAAMPPLTTFTTQPSQPAQTTSTASQPAYNESEDQHEPVIVPTQPTSPSPANKHNGHLTGQEIEQDEVDEQDDDFQTDTNPESRNQVSNNAILLDIMQSLPPMPAPVPQPSGPPVLSGRATRSLGSVLLEGHLVPQSRLEVAQNVQRMLRGVDLNYQLGEILLMFKLLTPDQLLAASLVSYGLISTTQIIALGRIRQELHSIGLEYDLENLLILFRILTPEQLREVKSSWQS